MDLLEKYLNILNKLSNIEGVYAVYIFGSYAKKRITKKSDLDICFFIDINNRELYEKIISYGSDELDINIFNDLPLSLKFDILKTGKIFRINDEQNFKEMKMKTLRKYKDESWVYKNIYFRRYGVKL